MRAVFNKTFIASAGLAAVTALASQQLPSSPNHGAAMAAVFPYYGSVAQGHMNVRSSERQRNIAAIRKLADFAEKDLGAIILSKEFTREMPLMQRIQTAQATLERTRGKTSRSASPFGGLGGNAPYMAVVAQALQADQPQAFILPNPNNAPPTLAMHLPSAVADAALDDTSLESSQVQLQVIAHEVGHLLQAKFAPHTLPQLDRATTAAEQDSMRLVAESQANQLMTPLLEWVVGTNDAERYSVMWSTYHQRLAQLYGQGLSLQADRDLAPELLSMTLAGPRFDGSTDSFQEGVSARLAELDGYIQEHQQAAASNSIQPTGFNQRQREMAIYGAVKERVHKIAAKMAQRNPTMDASTMAVAIYQTYAEQHPDSARVAHQVLSDDVFTKRFGQLGRGHETSLAFNVEPPARGGFSFAGWYPTPSLTLATTTASLAR